MGKQMESEKYSHKNVRDRETAAIVSSTAILGFFLIYWALQVQEVREMLALAYG
ncbi:MAG: hypothetical protein V7709_07265 [Halioglobus sp.]